MFSQTLRWLVGKVANLPPRLTGTISIERNIHTPMRDGVVLIGDRYHAPSLPNAAVVLMRSPYGRGSMFGIMAALLAERGCQVFAQSVRGTAGSEGQFDPMRQERADGADTVDWLRAQPWFGGKLFTFGMSYLGNTQWAAAMDRAGAIDGMSLGVTLSNFRDEFLGNGALTQAGMLAWTQTMLTITAGGKMQRRRPPPLDAHHLHMPLGTLDEAAFGKPVPWWKDWMAHSQPDDPWWQAMDYSPAVTATKAPAFMTGGWQDIFLPYQIRDFEARQAAGLPTTLTIGPWLHASPGGMMSSVREAATVFPALATGRDPAPNVRVFVQGGAQEWRDYPSWPPPGAAPFDLHLGEGGMLSDGPGEGMSTYTYDPANPTPAVHGPALMGGKKVRDMAALEARDDTISFRSAPLDTPLEIIGSVTANLAIQSDREHTDFYACLCDVDTQGRPIQVCDGLIRLRSGEGIRHISIQCWPTAWRFNKGHRIGLIIASGAFPRYSRNPGTGEPMASATDMVPARQEIMHAGSKLTFMRMGESV